ncbi:hypothetical protein ARMSODRAFT_967466 [Armillaria solidipes]|uniref:Uncharacterized protein n=1 Tax=Armillaria solidipes TaxID=1076256 RepID=A0A2H3B4I3_9AGAR|nr:hypothetical protein ARMSODRAFT_967466 [Armillaria solidipes]
MYKTSVIALILLFVSRAFGADISPADDEGASTSLDDRRTVLNILWSCLATIFASTWLAIHPNVPGQKITDKGAISRAVERAKIMGIAILAPEVIVSWAAEQFKVAWTVCHGTGISVTSVIHAWRGGESKDPHGLTMTHGFFLAMGGFCYTCVGYTEGWIAYSLDYGASHCPDDSRVNWISERIVRLDSLNSEPLFVKDLEEINAKTIEDKSKGDALSKTISILQISWFIAQCICRVIQHLPITLLEMTALAFAGISIVTYSLWWYKPLNVQYHISLDKPDSRKYTPTPKIILPQPPLPPASKNTPPFWSRLSMATAMYSLQGFLKRIMTTVLSMESGLEPPCNTQDGVFRFSSGRGRPEGLGGRIPNETWARFVMTVGVGSLFGGFHCAAWSFYFPSHAEMFLWRISSVAVLIGLLAASLLPCYHLIRSGNALMWAHNLDVRRRNPQWNVNTYTLVQFILTVISCAGIIAYIVGRMALVILAFMQLRSLPQLAYYTAQWTTYIPHI